MKFVFFLFAIMFFSVSVAQKHSLLQHGLVFGDRPGTTAMVDASKLEAYMDKKIRISTTIRGKVIKVTKQKGGWFNIDAGNGRIIAAHFKNYGINIPAGLQGKMVIVEGVAQKQIIADDLQHFAGDTVTGKKQHSLKIDPKRGLTFEVKGLMVD